MQFKALDPLFYDAITDKLYTENKFIDNFFDLIAKNITPPYSISLNGSWGSGKTTILKLLASKLLQDKTNRYPTMWFNPWEYERTGDVVLAFIQVLSDQCKNFWKIKQKELGIFGLAFLTSITFPN